MDPENHIALCLDPQSVTLPGSSLVAAIPFLKESGEHGEPFAILTRHDDMDRLTQQTMSPCQLCNIPGNPMAITAGTVTETLNMYPGSGEAVYCRGIKSKDKRQEHGLTVVSTKNGGWVFDAHWNHHAPLEAANALFELSVLLRSECFTDFPEVKVQEINRLLAIIPKYSLRKYGLPASVTSPESGQFREILSAELESLMHSPDAWFTFTRPGKSSRQGDLKLEWSSTTGQEVCEGGELMLNMLLTPYGANIALERLTQRESSGQEIVPTEWLSPFGTQLLLGNWQDHLSRQIRHHSASLRRAAMGLTLLASGMSTGDIRYFLLR
jgi:hypothetical protein